MATGEAVLTVDQDELAGSLESQILKDEGYCTSLVLRQTVAIEKITDDATYLQVCAKVLEAAGNIKRIENQLEPHRAARHAALQRIYQIKTRLLTPLEDAVKKGKLLKAAYEYEQEQKRKAVEEAQRKELEAQAQKQTEQEAEALFKEGREAEAVALLDTPIESAPVVVGKTVPKVAGFSKSGLKYTAEVVDLKALVQAVAKGEVPILAIMADQKWLDKQADAMKELLNIPGVKLKKDLRLGAVRAR